MVALAIPLSFLPENHVVSLLTSIPIDLLWAFFTVCLTVLFLESEPKTIEEQFPEIKEF